MSKVVKIILLAPGAAEAALKIGSDKKEFLEVMIEDRDENINTGPGLAVGVPIRGLPFIPGLPYPGIVPVPLSPASTTKIAPEEAVKRAVVRKLREEFQLDIDKSQLTIQTLTETTKEDGKFLYIALYKLSDSQKEQIERRHLFSPFLPMINFFPLAGLPIGLPFVDAGIARFLTTRFDIIRDRVYLGDPRVIFPSNILPYNPLYPVPFYSPYFPRQIVRHESTYRSPESIFGERSRPRSSSPSRSRSSSGSPRRKKEKRSREKYLKYKQKYLELKAKVENL